MGLTLGQHQLAMKNRGEYFGHTIIMFINGLPKRSRLAFLTGFLGVVVDALPPLPQQSTPAPRARKRRK